jgi:hypothetical protein
MGTKKEIDFFALDNCWSNGPEWYKRFFDSSSDARAVGECSTTYAMYPRFPDAPSRIAALLDGVRLVYIVRDPIERIRSHYDHAVLFDAEKRPIEATVLEDPDYVDISRYALQIGRYLPHFDVDQLLVVDSDDLKNRRQVTLRTIFGFIGVDPEWWDPMLEIEHYVTAERFGLRETAKYLRRVPTLRRLSRVAPTALRRRVASSTLLSQQRGTNTDVSPSLRAELTSRLAQDARELRRLCTSQLRAPEVGKGWLEGLTER